MCESVLLHVYSSVCGCVLTWRGSGWSKVLWGIMMLHHGTHPAVAVCPRSRIYCSTCNTVTWVSFLAFLPFLPTLTSETRHWSSDWGEKILYIKREKLTVARTEGWEPWFHQSQNSCPALWNGKTFVNLSNHLQKSTAKEFDILKTSYWMSLTLADIINIEFE